MTAVAAALAWAGSVQGQPCPTPSAADQTCTANCAQFTVGTAQGSAGDQVTVPISFAQGADDGQAGRGNDEVSAVAFTLGIPGTGDATPLVFDCSEGNLASGAVQPGAGIANDFTVVVENAQCINRNRCLCPTAEGQTRDNFVNLVVYGPKTLPDQGPVNIPVLPDSGEIARLTLRIAAGTPDSEIALHAFAATDGGSPVKPQFSANLSMGDQSACDVTGDGEGRSRVTFTDGRVTVRTTTQPCVGDCNGDGQVLINELVVGVNIALGNTPVSQCLAFDADRGGTVTINELIQGVNNALNGCPA